LKTRISLAAVFYLASFLWFAMRPSEMLLFPVVVLICAVQLSRILCSNSMSSVSLSTNVALVFLYIYPTIALAGLRSLDVYLICFLAILTTDLYIVFCSKIDRRRSRRMQTGTSGPAYFRAWAMLMIWCAVSGLVLGSDPLSRALAFAVPFGVSLVLYEHGIRSGRVTFSSKWPVVVYVLLVILYARIYWSGYGRLVIGTYLMMPFLIAAYNGVIYVRPWQVVVVSPVALWVAQYSRYNSVNSLDALFVGSAGHHLIVGESVYNYSLSKSSADFQEFFSQLSLLFFNWIPRAVWPDKPLGVGFTSVDTIFGREGVGENYSQSIGFVGEQFYFFGELFWLGLLVFVLCIALTRLAISRLDRGMVSLLVIFDVNLISYLWGGGATFGSRVWFFLLPAWMCMLWIRRRQRRSGL